MAPRQSNGVRHEFVLDHPGARSVTGWVRVAPDAALVEAKSTALPPSRNRNDHRLASSHRPRKLAPARFTLGGELVIEIVGQHAFDAPWMRRAQARGTANDWIA